MALTDEKNINAQDGIIDINIEGVKRQRFRINGDPKAIIELNLSDIGIAQRLEEGLEKLQAEMEKISNLPDDDESMSEKMKQADKQMREYIDYIFDYPVSAVCAKYGTMYDPYNGMFRYEHIIDALTKLYTDNLNDEYKKMKTRIQKHTDKYTKAVPKPTKRSRK